MLKKCLADERMNILATQLTCHIRKNSFLLALSELCTPLDSKEASTGLPDGRLFLSASLCVSNTQTNRNDLKLNEKNPSLFFELERPFPEILRSTGQVREPQRSHWAPPQRSGSKAFLLQGRYLLTSRNIISWAREN